MMHVYLECMKETWSKFGITCISASLFPFKKRINVLKNSNLSFKEERHQRFACTTYLIKIQTENVLKTITITDETTRDIIKFFKGFPLNSCCDDVPFTSSLYGETEEESTESLPVEIKKKWNNLLLAILCKIVQSYFLTNKF